MLVYKALPVLPDPKTVRDIKRTIKGLLDEILPTLSLRDVSGTQHRNVLKFQSTARKKLREVIDLTDRRSLTVKLYYTDPAAGSGKPPQYHWMVQVSYDNKTTPRELLMLFLAKLA